MNLIKTVQVITIHRDEVQWYTAVRILGIHWQAWYLKQKLNYDD